MSTNISKQKRDALISKINAIKEYILSHPQDENALNLLSYTNEIENELRAKRFGLVFEEHLENIDEVLSNHLPYLKEEEKLFINNGGEMNFLIEGDNLASLNLLLKTHKGKIDLIYIDPPYNTGNKDFIYDDNFVDSTDTFRHSKWLSFMEKRLKLARKLLSENGVIFISIDDNEQAELKLLCDSVFGEANFVADLIWQNKYTIANDKTNGLSTQTEHILCYCTNSNNISFTSAPLREEYIKSTYKNPDNDPNGAWRTVQMFKYKNPKSFTVVSPTGKTWERPWNFTPESFKELDEKGCVYWGKDGNSCPTKKVYLKDSKGTGRRNLLLGEEVGFTANSSAELKEIFEATDIFQYSKPSTLIAYLIQMCEHSSTVLDFFAGSGTTGHAVMKLNAEDGVKRKFILCTNNENNIARDVCYERIKRVVNKEKYEASLKYFKVDYLSISDKLYYEYADELLKHVRELVELENGINFNDNGEIAIILTEDELDEFTKTIPSSCKKIYLGHDILLSLDQEQELKKRNIQINIIPDYYYNEESI